MFFFALILKTTNFDLDIRDGHVIHQIKANERGIIKNSFGRTILSIEQIHQKIHQKYISIEQIHQKIQF